MIPTSTVITHLASEAHAALDKVADFGEIWTHIAHNLLWLLDRFFHPTSVICRLVEQPFNKTHDTFS